MQFIAQVVLDDLNPSDDTELAGTMLSIFKCGNDPGMCDDWKATSGANQALLFRQGELAAAKVPDEGVTALDATNQITYTTVATDEYIEASQSVPDVLGQLGGTPGWIQDEETPTCPSCAKPMTFIAQLDEGPDSRTAINFGSGYGYAFACGPCAEAAFCWQC